MPPASARLLWALVCVLGLLFSFAPTVSAQDANDVGGESSVLVLGRISDDPKAHYEQLEPLLQYLVPRLHDVGIRSGRILMARDLQQMSSYLRRGRVDLINETAGNAAGLEDRGVAHSFLISERDGVSHYHAIFFVRKDSPIHTLHDLQGHSVAFQNPLSTSAYYLPAAQLLDAGESLEPLLSPTDRPAAGRIGYVFARTELNISTWVHKRLVAAGVLSNIDWGHPQRMPSVFARDFRVIGQSEDVPRAVMLARNGLDPRLEARLREVLLEAASDPAAAAALRSFMGTSRFVPITAQDRAMLRSLGRGVQRVRREVE
ncbi:MAG: phosphate/phosphite/phosphonate ABC transporter substrate-binding protein [Thermomonas sp.]|nr:phosphate/phosphite/phosphonate ABC transporter substrate-binding protein [Thermomonas sp.]